MKLLFIFFIELFSVFIELVKVVGRKDVILYFNKFFEIVFIVLNVLFMIFVFKRLWMWVLIKLGVIYLFEKFIILLVILGFFCWNLLNLLLIILR